MNFGEMGKKAEQFLDSEKGEKYSDEALEKGERLLDERTGGKYDQQIDKGREFADEHIGMRDPADPAGPQNVADSNDPTDPTR